MKHEDWFNLVVCACLSVLGGVGQMLSVKNRKPIKMDEIKRKTIVSLSLGVGAFVLIYAFSQAARENDFIVFAFGYIAGWGGPWFMNGIVDKFASDKGIEKSDK